jgi:GAF domain-containing protein
MLGVPINDSQGNVIGVLLALNKHSGNFSKKDEAVLMQLSNQAGVIIKNAIYYQKAINNELKSKALLKFVRQINKDAPGQSLAVELVTKAKDLLQAETCNIFMVDYAGDILVPIATDSPFDYRLPLSSGVLGQCVKNAEIINIDHNDSRFSREFDEKFGYITETLLIVPIKIESRVVGLVQITNKHSDSMFGDVKIYSKFDDDDAELLITFNEILGKKLEKLFDSLGRKTNKGDDPAVKFQGSFGKNKYKTQELPEGAIKESEEEDDAKV